MLWAESDIASSDSELSLTSEQKNLGSWEEGEGACGGLLLWGESAIVTFFFYNDEGNSSFNDFRFDVGIFT